MSGTKRAARTSEIELSDAEITDAVASDSTRSAPKPDRPDSRTRVRDRASEMTPQQRAEFEKKFAQSIRPAVEKWCALYAGHSPIRASDVTADKLRELVFPGSPCQGYGFVIDGTTLCVEDNRGVVYVEYLMAPAARNLLRLSTGDAPLADISVSREEIVRLLQADSGKEFPPSQIAIRPTNRASAMNGGVFVDAGEGVNDPKGGPPPQFSIVFGPDGNLAYYLRSKPEAAQGDLGH